MSRAAGQDVAVVVGAGIGGLATAVALTRRGWHVTVLERAQELEPVGAGIALAPNALRALAALGLADTLRGMASLQGQVGLRRPDGTWLMRADVAAADDRFTALVVHRARLVDLLAGALPDGALRTGQAVVEVVPGGRSERATVRTQAREHRADLVVAADGIDSPVRTALFPEHPGPVATGTAAWRFVTEAPDGLQPAETWGRGSVVGLTPMADGRVYGYATASVPAGCRFEDDADELRRRFGGWHEPIPTLLAGLTHADVLHHDLRRLAVPLPAFDVGRVALVGDAAHAMTPNLGQGGCQALEDAVVLAAVLDRVTVPGVHDRVLGAVGSDRARRVPTALTAYTAARLPRTRRIARMSYQLGVSTTWTSPLAVTLRDTAMRATARVAGPALVRRLESVTAWHPPT